MQGNKSSNFATNAATQSNNLAWSFIKATTISRTGIWIGVETMAWCNVHFAMNVFDSSYLMTKVSPSTSQSLEWSMYWMCDSVLMMASSLNWVFAKGFAADSVLVATVVEMQSLLMQILSFLCHCSWTALCLNQQYSFSIIELDFLFYMHLECCVEFEIWLWNTAYL